MKRMLDFGFYNMDCMDGMKHFPDKYFDLAIVDPPYGIHVKTNMGRRKNAKNNSNPIADWDSAPPNKSYFEELFRVSKHSIIWGGNYFELPPTKSFIVWDKPNMSEEVSFSMCEYAWTDFEVTAKTFRKFVRDEDKIHPTQKPVPLYEWLLRNYAKSGDKILDTHVGSASSLIACHRQHFDYVGFEINKDFYESATKRLQAEIAQTSLF